MGRARGGELVWVVLSVIVVAAVTLFASPFPPLLQWTRSEGWCRGIEFPILLTTAWMLLSGVGFIRAKVALKTDGVSVERLAGDEAAPGPVAMLAEQLVETQRENAILHRQLDAQAQRLAYMEALSHTTLAAGPETSGHGPPALPKEEAHG